MEPRLMLDRFDRWLIDVARWIVDGVNRRATARHGDAHSCSWNPWMVRRKVQP